MGLPWIRSCFKYCFTFSSNFPNFSGLPLFPCSRTVISSGFFPLESSCKYHFLQSLTVVSGTVNSLEILLAPFSAAKRPNFALL